MSTGKRARSERSDRRTKKKDSSVSIIRRLGPDGKIVRRGKEHLPDAEWDIEVEFTQVGERLYPFRLELRPGIFQDGVPPPGGITARLLHGIRLGELVDQFRAEQRGNRLAQEWFLGLRTKRTYQLPPPTNRVGPKGFGEAHYQDVALAYLEAVRTDPRRPIERMTPSYPGYHTTNVRDWVGRARQKGYLTSLGRGRSGGEATQKLADALRARRKRRRRTRRAVKG